MTKKEFLDALALLLRALPQKEREERLGFYAEQIDDRIEEGLSEAEAVAGLGTVEAVAAQIMDEVSLSAIAAEKAGKKRRLNPLSLTLILLGSPVWLSLLASAVSVLISLFAALWSVVISLWATFGALIGAALGGLVAGVVFALFGGHIAVGVAVFACALLCAGLSVPTFLFCRAVSRGAFVLSRYILLGIKKCFVGGKKR